MSMFFLNLDLETEERFDISKFLEYTDCFDPLTSFTLDQIKKLPVGGNYAVSGEEGRPDLLSYRIYGNTQYWWILMFYNDKINIEDIKTSDILYYPKLDELENFYFSLKIKQTKSES